MVEEYRPNSKGHWRNEGRDSLWDLDDRKFYLIEGTNSGVYETKNPNNIRFALADVLVREYRTDIRYDDIPVVAMASHINTIRKRQGMEHANTRDGERTVWIGRLERYSSSKDAGVERVSFKLMRDTNVIKEIENIERRIRNLRNQWAFVSGEECETRVKRTLSLISRMTNVSREYLFVPWLTKEELVERLSNATAVCHQQLSRLSQDTPKATTVVASKQDKDTDTLIKTIKDK